VICFNDTTYCNNPNCDGSCGRQWTPQLQLQAEHWWGGPNVPVTFADFHSFSQRDSDDVHELKEKVK